MRKFVNMVGTTLGMIASWYILSVIMLLAMTGEVHLDFWDLF